MVKVWFNISACSPSVYLTENGHLHWSGRWGGGEVRQGKEIAIMVLRAVAQDVTSPTFLSTSTIVLTMGPRWLSFLSVYFLGHQKSILPTRKWQGMGYRQCCLWPFKFCKGHGVEEMILICAVAFWLNHWTHWKSYQKLFCSMKENHPQFGMKFYQWHLRS